MIDANVLLNEGRCLGCHSNASESEMILMALLQRIVEAGGSGGAPAAPNQSVQFNDAGAFGGDADFTWNKTTNLLSLVGAANNTMLSLSGYSLTGANAQSMISLAGTWNTTGTPTAIDLNITDTASNAASLLMSLRTGGNTRFSVNKAGSVIAGQSLTSNFAGTFFIIAAAGKNLSLNTTAGGALSLTVPNASFQANNSHFGWRVNALRLFDVDASTILLSTDNTVANARDLTVRVLRTTPGFTVATLPAAGTAGRRTYVTDATAPTFLGALIGGGAVVTPVFDDGSAWISA